MNRWGIALLMMAFLSAANPVTSYPASLSLYDDFSGDTMDGAKWQTLEQVREIRGGKLVSTLRVAGPPGIGNNNLAFRTPTSIQNFQADVRLNEASPPPASDVRVRLVGAFYGDGSGGPGSTGDVWAQVFLRGSASSVEIRYSVFKCTNTTCSATSGVVVETTLGTTTWGVSHTLGVAWDGSLLTFTVDGVPTVVDPKPGQPIGSPTPSQPTKFLGTMVRPAGAGGEGYVAGDFDNVYVNGALYDTFDGAPYSGPRLDQTKWDRGAAVASSSPPFEVVREVRSGKLVSKVAGTGVTNDDFKSRARFINDIAVTAMQADVSVTDYQATAGAYVEARLLGSFYNDGSSTGPSDYTGTVHGSIYIRSDNGGGLFAKFHVGRLIDPQGNFDTPICDDTLGGVALGETHTLSVIWDGSVFTYGMDGDTRTCDPTPLAPMVKAAPDHFTEIDTHVIMTADGAYGDIGATFDNVYVNPEAAQPPKLRPSFRRQVAGDVVSAGIGLRGTGTGTINLVGIPGGATVEKAFLYWATLGSNGTFTTPTLNGSPVSGSLIGRSSDPWWGTSQAFAYRADVTSLVTGNGVYTIADLPKGPLPPANFTVNDSEGASMVVLYSQPSAPPRVITIHDGAVTLSGSRVQYYATTLDGFTAATPPSGARLTFVVGDGQAGIPEFAGLNTTQLATNTFSGSDGNYWDTRIYEVSTALSGGDTRAIAELSTASDSLVWVAAILSVPGTIRTDAVGVFRPADGTFYLDFNASGQWDGCGTDRCLQIGLTGDIPLVGDWNGSGSSKVGAFRPSDGTFYLDYNGNGVWDGCGTDRCLQIGLNGDIPLVGDWNGSGTSKVGAFRPSDGTFYLDYNGNGLWEGCGIDRCLQIGLNGDVPLVGDWNGSGTSKVGAFRPSDGTFYLDYNGNGSWDGCGTDRCLQIGMLNDSPLIGDWNGSGTSKVGVFRPSDGTFYLDYNGSGTWEGCGTDRCLKIGMLNDTPLVGDWDGTGTSKIGVFRPSDGTFYLDYNGSGTWEGCGTDRCLQIGMSGDAPLVGKW